MLAPRVTRRIAVVASEPGAGATTVALGLGNALAMQGERALLIDESAHHGTPASTLADVLAGRLTLDAALATHASGLPVLPAGPQVALANLPADALPGIRTVLADARIGADGALSPFASGSHNMVVVMRPERASITAAYACIKRLHHSHACRRFHLVVNMAANEATVTAIARNLASTASQYLGVEITCAGYVPADPLVTRAMQLGRSVIEAFPAAPATAALRRVASHIGAWPLHAAAPPQPAHAAVAA